MEGERQPSEEGKVDQEKRREVIEYLRQRAIYERGQRNDDIAEAYEKAVVYLEKNSSPESNE